MADTFVTAVSVLTVRIDAVVCVRRLTFVYISTHGAVSGVTGLALTRVGTRSVDAFCIFVAFVHALNAFIEILKDLQGSAGIYARK